MIVMSTPSTWDFQNARVQNRLLFPSTPIHTMGAPAIRLCRSMIRENRQLGTNEPVEFEKKTG